VEHRTATSLLPLELCKKNFPFVHHLERINKSLSYMAFFYQRASDLPSRVRASLGGYMGGTPCGDSKSFFLFFHELKEPRPKVFFLFFQEGLRNRNFTP